MTITQAAERFSISLEKLKNYEDMGLFDCHKQPDGTIEYEDELLDYVGIINVLTEAGAPPDALQCFMNRLIQSNLSKSEKLVFLRKQRQNLMDSIHTKQKTLDQLDYLIYEAMKR